MITHLTQKLTQTIPYADHELDWLLTHIGDPDPSTRDNLVYASLCHGIMAELVTRDQLQHLFSQVRERKLQTIGLGQEDETTLTRSFTSLFHALLLHVDGNEDSLYHHILSASDRQALFEQLLAYLPAEIDQRGYDEKLGWIHAIAHGADALLTAACHPDFPPHQLHAVLTCLKQTITQQNLVLVAGEPARLAEVVVHLVLIGKLDQDTTADWLSELIISGDTPTDYANQLNIRAFLSALYFRLKRENKLDLPLETSLLNHPHLTD